MKSQRSDFELLREFVRHSDQDAFAVIVKRHLNLVFATAVRKVSDEGAAREIAQNVFTSLAKKSWQFAPDDSLPAWLYRAALLEAREWLRGELRRRRREQTAIELGTAMKIPEENPTCRALWPLLDEALLSLREKDRAALLLRFFEDRSLREVGESLGVSEDTAQKRVASAIGKVASYFERRGYRTVTAGAVTAALKAGAVSVPDAAAHVIAHAALTASPSVSGVAAFLGNVASWSKLQTAAVCAGVAVVSIAWQTRETHASGREVVLAKQQLDQVRMQVHQTAATVEQLQATAVRLEEHAANAEQSLAREHQARQQLETLRARSRAVLSAEDYRWPDDLPFVRVPKWALASIEAAGGPQTPMALQTKVSDFLDLTPAERDITTQIFSNYFAGIDRLVEDNLYETNSALSFEVPPNAETKVFVLEPLGPRIYSALVQLSKDLTAVLGRERWAMVEPNNFEFTHYEQVRLLGYTQYAWNKRQEIAISLFTDDRGSHTVSWRDEGGAGGGPFPIYVLKNPSMPTLTLGQGPPALVSRVQEYAQTLVAMANSNSNSASK